MNGPAEAYRHIVRVGGMASRPEPNDAGRYAELREIQGQASAMRRDAFGQGRSPIIDQAATAMDRRNYLIGVSIGPRARRFDDALRMTRETIDRSPKDGAGGGAGDGLVHVRAHRRDGHPVRAYPPSPP